jgi:uncharacterized protein (TIGR02466 family)
MATNRRERRQAARTGSGDGAAPDPRLVEARRLHQAGDGPGAERAYRRLLDGQPGNPVALHDLGVLLAQRGRMDDALAALEAAAGLAPGRPDWQSDLGNALLALDRVEEAVAAYRRAIAVAPGFAQGHYNLANALRAAGRPAEAIAAYRRAAEISPGVPQIHANLGVTLLQLADLDGAAAALGRAVEIAPGFAEAHYNLGIVHRKMGLHDRAGAAFERALELDPAMAMAHVGLGNLALYRDDFAAAADCFRRAISLDPGLVEAHANLGSALHEQGELEAAADILRRTLEIAPDYVRGHVNLGITLEELDDREGAVACFQRALEIDPGDIRALAHATIALQRVGRRREAEAIFDFGRMIRVLDIGPLEGWESTEALNAALADHVTGHPTRLLDRPAKSTTKGSQTLEVLYDDSPAIESLRGVIEAAVNDYMATVMAQPGGPFAGRLPERWRLTGWGVVLDTGGYQSPHVHPEGIVSGVYYVRLPPSVAAGSNRQQGHIQFGQVIREDDAASSLLHTVQPSEGRLVLFPSYFWHRTIPFDDDANRISIAFDAVPG